MSIVRNSGLMFIALWSVSAAVAAELSPETLRAWDEYVKNVNDAIETRWHGNPGFLWIDEDPERVKRVRNGAIVITGTGPKSIPDGLIHDWLGAAFIPGTTLDHVLQVLDDYDNYKVIYQPGVADSHTLERTPDHDRYSMRWVRKVFFVTVALDTVYESRFVRNHNRYFSVDRTTAIQEIKNYGRKDQHKLPPDTGTGYLWRMFSTVRLEERDGGVYVEMQALALTRDIPAGLGWLLNSLVSRLPRSLLTSTLEKTRNAVLQ